MYITNICTVQYRKEGRKEGEVYKAAYMYSIENRKYKYYVHHNKSTSTTREIYLGRFLFWVGRLLGAGIKLAGGGVGSTNIL